MKLVSFNVNGIRAILKKDFTTFFNEVDADILCLQETKAEPDQVDQSFAEGYHALWNAAEKKGYSGTAVFSKTKPITSTCGIGIPEHDTEGRVITAEFPDFHLVNVYTPNSQNELRRLPYRQDWDQAFLTYLQSLEKTKPVLACGDFNVAHQEIDLARPKQNRRNPGFSDEERAGFTNYMEAGFIDTFRHFHPNKTEAYSWWSYRAGARAKNIGWRIDYWLASAPIKPNLQSATILSEIQGSDHCPVQLEII